MPSYINLLKVVIGVVAFWKCMPIAKRRHPLRIILTDQQHSLSIIHSFSRMFTHAHSLSGSVQQPQNGHIPKSTHFQAVGSLECVNGGGNRRHKRGY